VGTGEGPPSLLLDAGTGLGNLGSLVDGGFRGAVLLTHWHWDHTHGIPFCPQLDHHDARVRLMAPGPEPARAVLSRMLGPPHFPISPEGLRGAWTFENVPAELEIDGLRVSSGAIPHKGGRTLGYRVGSGSCSLAYLPDHAVADEPSPEVERLVAGVDLLIHDGQHTEAEFAARRHLGHSSIERAIALSDRMGCRRLLLFHHDPRRADEDLDAIARSLPSHVQLARQGSHIEVGGVGYTARCAAEVGTGAEG
jgi:phosphoribosyl 1,2-cyclic phosphodiesterase